jgi:hypothetical protein
MIPQNSTTTVYGRADVGAVLCRLTRTSRVDAKTTQKSNNLCVCVFGRQPVRLDRGTITSKLKMAAQYSSPVGPTDVAFAAGWAAVWQDPTNGLIYLIYS